MKKNIILATFALFALCASAQTDYAKLTQNLPFKMTAVKAPVIPKNEVKLTDFGAVGDGETDDTEALERLFASAAENQKAVYIPAGTYMIRRPLTIKSGMEVYGDGNSSIIKKFPAA